MFLIYYKIKTHLIIYLVVWTNFSFGLSFGQRHEGSASSRNSHMCKMHYSVPARRVWDSELRGLRVTKRIYFMFSNGKRLRKIYRAVTLALMVVSPCWIAPVWHKITNRIKGKYNPTFAVLLKSIKFYLSHGARKDSERCGGTETISSA